LIPIGADEEVMVKSGLAVCDTIIVRVVLCVNPPLVPVIRIGYVPELADELTDMVAVAVTAPPDNSVIGFGEKFKEIPGGLLVVSCTAEENPLKELTVTVAVVDVPG